MAELRVNPQTCTRCGLCAADCPLGIIAMPDGQVPRYVEDGAARCVICGHCEAVCPEAAVEVHDPRLSPVRHALSPAQLDPELLAAYLRQRRSIRRYKSEPVDRALLERLLEVARHAPSGINSQAVHWLVIHDTAELRRLTDLAIDWMRSLVAAGDPMAAYVHMANMVAAWEAGRDPICRNAPHLIVAHAHHQAPTAPKDALIALAQMDAAAPSLGLGSCWAGLFQMAAASWKPLREALALPPGHEPIYALMVGTPAVRYHRVPRRNPLSVAWR